MCKVLMIAPTPFFADRGCHVRIQGEARALRAKGCDVLVCTYHHGRDVEGVTTARIPRMPWYRKLAAGPSNNKYVADVLLAGLALRKGLSWRPDVIHGHLHEGALIGRFAGSLLRRPVVFDYQGSLTDELTAHEYLREGRLLQRGFRRLERWIDRGPDLVVCSSGRAAEHLRATSPGAAVETVMDGVDTDLFRPVGPEQRRRIRDRHALPADATLAVFVGVLTEYQGIDLLLEHLGPVLEAEPSLHVVFVGYPEVGYQARASDLGLAEQVTFTGRVPFEETPALTAAADIALSPKISHSEGNLKLYNYAACGVPVVLFDNEVNREVLGPAGVYAPAGDGAAFVEEIVRLSRDAERRRAMGAAARERAVKRLSWARAADELLRVYEQLGVQSEESVEACAESAAS